jgi:hypothetical protein
VSERVLSLETVSEHLESILDDAGIAVGLGVLFGSRARVRRPR